jgi:hypothetical protein
MPRYHPRRRLGKHVFHCIEGAPVPLDDLHQRLGESGGDYTARLMDVVEDLARVLIDAPPRQRAPRGPGRIM